MTDQCSHVPLDYKRKSVVAINIILVVNMMIFLVLVPILSSFPRFLVSSSLLMVCRPITLPNATPTSDYHLFFFLLTFLLLGGFAYVTGFELDRRSDYLCWNYYSFRFTVWVSWSLLQIPKSADVCKPLLFPLSFASIVHGILLVHRCFLGHLHRPDCLRQILVRQGLPTTLTFKTHIFL